MKRKSLGSPRTSHEERAEAALAHTERFLKAAARPGQRCDVLLQNTTHARIYGELAVHEAAHAKSGRGPTALQSRASQMTDEATRAWQRAVHNCTTRASARGKYPRR